MKYEDDPLSPALAALADPTRRAILARLAKGEATVTELTEPLGVSMPAVSRHLKLLEAAGLISRGREAQTRPCRLRPEGLGPVVDWLSGLQRDWEQRLDRLEALLSELQADSTPQAQVPDGEPSRD